MKRALLTIGRGAAGGSCVIVGMQLLDKGIALLTRPNPSTVVLEAEHVTRAAADVPHPFTQEGTS